MTVKITHFRLLDDDTILPCWVLRKLALAKEVKPYGGMTIVNILDDKGNYLADGIAVCNDRDNFTIWWYDHREYS